MIARATPGTATRADLLALPAHVVGELVDGALYTSPRPAVPHARAAGAVSYDLLGPFDRGHGDGPGGWWILVELELHLGDDILLPDVAGWRRDKMPVLPDTAAFTAAPDWVREVVSPSTGRLDRVVKMPRYARAGVSHLWLVEPVDRTLEVYGLDATGRWVVLSTHGGDDRVRAAPFQAVEIDLSRWWDRGLPPSP